MSVFRELLVTEAHSYWLEYLIPNTVSLVSTVLRRLHPVGQTLKLTVSTFPLFILYSLPLFCLLCFWHENNILCHMDICTTAAKRNGCVCAVILLPRYLFWIRPWADSSCKWCTVLGGISGRNPFFVNSPMRLCLSCSWIGDGLFADDPKRWQHPGLIASLFSHLQLTV